MEPAGKTPAEVTAQKLQQDRTIEHLQADGWVVIDRYTTIAEGGVLPSPKAIADAETREANGQVLMQLTTPKGVSHILIMRDGERVDSSQRLGKQAAQPTEGEP